MNKPVIPSLSRILDQLGPSSTPQGQVSWDREFPMAAERLGFSASLSCSAEGLQARVIQQDAHDTQEIFLATWGNRQGSWLFEGARLDGKPQSEPQAVEVFEDYVQALGASPRVSTPRRSPGM